ncbi:MAG: hypothetical protein KA586_08480 [Candidatus Promineofilum sp.]|nr:hypothetical protein [Promineifilum sp.]
MAIKDPRLRSLLTQADRNAANGKNAAAESIYRQIVDMAPDAETAWLGLAEVVVGADEKRAAYERALDLAPGMPAAIAGLARLDGRPVPPEIAAALEAAQEPQEIAPFEAGLVDEGADNVTTTDSEAAYELYCYRHPDRATSLRCYNCDRPICSTCANKTPVGYICPECQREAEDAFFNSKPLDYLIAALVSLPISLLTGYLIVRFFSGGFLFFIIIFFVSGAIGSFIGRTTKRAIGGRRGRYLPGLVVAMMILGVAIPALPILLAVLTGSVGGLMALLGPGIYLFVGASAAYWQMR